MRRAVMRLAGRPDPAAPAGNGSSYGTSDPLDAQIDDLLANIEAESEPWDRDPRAPVRARRFRRTRRLAHRIRRVWGWRRTTALFAATLLVSTGIAVATVYVAAQLLG